MKLIKDKYHLIFLLVLFVFLIDKISYLSLNFFWDEAWVYGNAITQFTNSNIPMLSHPTTIDLTRGHPLLFYSLASVWGKIFGNSLISLHLFPLLFTVSFFIYLSTQKKNIPPSQILMITILLVGNEIFFTQASLLLPEIMLGIFLFLSLFHVIREKWISYILFFTLALYTKESAIVLYPVIFLLIIYNKVTIGKNYKFLQDLTLSIIPIALASLHYIHQKNTFDWYFYPLHIEFIHFSYEEISEKFSRYYRAIFDTRLQYVLNVSFIISVCLILNHQKSKYRTPITISIIIAFISMLIFNSQHASLLIPGMISLITLGIGLLFIEYDNNTLQKLVLGGWLFIIGFILFSALNFFSTRYIIPVIIFYAFVYTIIIHKLILIKKHPKNIYLILLGVVLLVGRFHKKEISDIDTAYKFAIKTHNEIIDYLIQNVDSNDSISTGFIELNILSNSNCSYLKQEQVFTSVYGLSKLNSSYYVITNLEGHIDEKRAVINLADYELVAHFSNNKSIGEVYKLKE